MKKKYTILRIILSLALSSSLISCNKSSPTPEEIPVSAELYDALKTTQASMQLASASFADISAALKLISPADPTASIQMQNVLDASNLPDLQNQIGILLQMAGLDPGVAQELNSLYLKLFGVAYSNKHMVAVSRILAPGGLFNQMVAALVAGNPADLPNLPDLVKQIDDIIKQMQVALANLIKSLPPPPVPAKPNAPPVPACTAPSSDPTTSCGDYVAYVACLAQKSLADCKASCMATYPKSFMNQCVPVTVPSPNAICTDASGSITSVTTATTGYSCTQKKWNPNLFGNAACPATNVDANDSTTKCSDWDALKACLMAAKICPPGMIVVPQLFGGLNVVCTDGSGNLSSRPVGKPVCKPAASPLPLPMPNPPVPGNGMGF